MKKLTNLVFWTFAILLAGCQGTGPLATAPVNSQPAETAPSSLEATLPPPAASAIPTGTPITTLNLYPSATATQTKTGTPTVVTATPPEAPLEFQCLEVAPKLPDEVNSTGIIVLDSRVVAGGLHKRDTFLLNMATGKTAQIARPAENQIFHTISPDRKLLAYQSAILDATGNLVRAELVIVDADGKRLKTIPWEEGWVNIPGWLDNERLVINIAGLDPEENEAIKASTLLVLDPFSGKREVLRPDFPEIYHYHPIPYWDGWSIARYDPSLTRVAYLQITKEGDYALALLDLQKRQLLASLIPYSVSMPSWSPDGSRLAADAPVNGQRADELFLMSRDGQIEQLTNFDAHEDVFLFNLNWSPDGRYIAAWMARYPLQNVEWAELVIVDTASRQVTDYCVREKYQKGAFGVPTKPIWSPDGRQLIIYDRYEEDHSRVILIDRVQGIAAQIAADMEPFGWMVSP